MGNAIFTGFYPHEPSGLGGGWGSAYPGPTGSRQLGPGSAAVSQRNPIVPPGTIIQVPGRTGDGQGPNRNLFYVHDTGPGVGSGQIDLMGKNLLNTKGAGEFSIVGNGPQDWARLIAAAQNADRLPLSTQLPIAPGEDYMPVPTNPAPNENIGPTPQFDLFRGGGGNQAPNEDVNWPTPQMDLYRGGGPADWSNPPTNEDVSPTAQFDLFRGGNPAPNEDIGPTPQFSLFRDAWGGPADWSNPPTNESNGPTPQFSLFTDGFLPPLSNPAPSEDNSPTPQMDLYRGGGPADAPDTSSSSNDQSSAGPNNPAPNEDIGPTPQMNLFTQFPVSDYNDASRQYGQYGVDWGYDANGDPVSYGEGNGPADQATTPTATTTAATTASNASGPADVAQEQSRYGYGTGPVTALPTGAHFSWIGGTPFFGGIGYSGAPGGGMAPTASPVYQGAGADAEGQAGSGGSAAYGQYSKAFETGATDAPLSTWAPPTGATPINYSDIKLVSAPGSANPQYAYTYQGKQYGLPWTSNFNIGMNQSLGNTGEASGFYFDPASGKIVSAPRQAVGYNAASSKRYL